VFNPDGEKIDLTPYFTIGAIGVLSVGLLVFISIFMSQCREKSLIIFKELDLVGLTGKNKSFLGGVVTLYYFMIVGLIVLGFIVHYAFFNSWLEMQEYQQTGHWEFVTSGWNIELKFYSSLIEEPSTKVIDLNNPHAASNLDNTLNDLCFKDLIKYHASDYFELGHLKKHVC